MSEDLIKKLEQQVAFLEGKLAYYENDGTGKLYYSLQRKANEMAELLNRTNLLNVELIDPKDKTFERLQKLWVDAADISNSIKALEAIARINVEQKDTKETPVQVANRPFSPESVADAVGELAGKRY